MEKITNIHTKPKIKVTDGIVTVTGVKIEGFLPEGLTAEAVTDVDNARDKMTVATLGAVQDYVEKHGLPDFTAKPISLGGNTTLNISSMEHQINAEVKTKYSAELTAVFARADEYAAKALVAITEESTGDDAAAAEAA